MVVAEERQRMAREIHDTVSQMLFSSSMIDESLAIDRQFTDVTILNQLRHIFRLNRGALAEMRMLLMEYKPENLVKAELPVLFGVSENNQITIIILGIIHHITVKLSQNMRHEEHEEKQKRPLF